MSEHGYMDAAALPVPREPYRLRPNWDMVWMTVAEDISTRSLCIRSKVGAVIVDDRNRIVASGYNNPPAGFQHRNEACDSWCDRGTKTVAERRGYEIALLARDYSDCPSLHAEANALMTADRSAWQGGTIYVTTDVCFTCAKLIANSGLERVVVKTGHAEHREPTRTYGFLRDCGLTVESFHDLPRHDV